MRQSFAKFAILSTAIMAFPMISFAGAPMKAVLPVVETPVQSRITADLGADVYSQYIFHGITLQNEGAILQPYANFYFNLYNGNGTLNKVDLNLGVWNSLGSIQGNSNLRSTTGNWFEFDFLAGLSFTFAKNFTFTPSYVAYTSPGGYFSTAQVARLKLGVNDSDWLHAFALNPYVLVEGTLEGIPANGGDTGWYYEVGIAPGYKAGPVQITVPVTAGFGSNNYYAGNAGYGFFSAGLALGYQLTCIPAGFGTWTVSANATYYNFGTANTAATTVKNDSNNAVVFGGGFKIAF